MKNRKQTSERIAELAARRLADPKTSKREKSLAGSALAQAGSGVVSRQKRAARA